LKPSEQVRVVKGWLLESKQFLVDLRLDVDENITSDPIRNMGFQNLIYLAEARHEWLKHLLTKVKPGTASSTPNREKE
jgi:hypothetical protein